ncbi:efflux RND transporter periplasmic adaptor subunit [Desertibaculum subflavum]|uniref:efflux RND transporter periplasmic adaptor subunit n=1 Tax=Desertibaculum subflavum TaxID=2268458 RepID=UPI000E66DF9F
MRKWLVRGSILLLVAVIAAAAAWWQFGPVRVQAVRPQPGPAVEAVYGTGTVEPVVMFPVAPKLAGRLRQLMVDEGSTVREGQVLAELDNRELSASVREWEARVNYSESQYRRAEDLYKNRVGSEAARDQARNELATARASLERARSLVAEMTLAAPVDGVIIRRDGEIGELIQAADPIFWMSCCGALRITAEIDEEDIRRVRAGQKVLVRADAFPDRVFEGRVAEITPKGDAVARSFRVRIALPNETPLMIGMTADTNIVVAERANALLVPATAVSDGKLWLVRDGRAVRQAVTVGVAGDSQVEIRSGIGADDLIVVQPGERLREGRRVSAEVVP